MLRLGLIRSHAPAGTGIVVAAIVLSACTSNTGPAPESLPGTDAPTSAQTTVAPPPASTQPAPASTTSPEIQEDPKLGYAAIAWESAAKVVLLRQTDEFSSCETTARGSDCGPVQKTAEVEVPAGPHNVAAFGSVVLVTHPRIGQLTRYDVGSGQLMSVDLGREPHDVKFA